MKSPSEWLWLLPALIGFVAWLEPYVDFLRSRWPMRYLENLPADGQEPLPLLSIVVPALNEEATIEPAMRSLVALDYPRLEVIAVNDRSTDRTGEILDEFARNEPRLRVIHVHELPAGWLGKNHALHLGAQEAAGEFILFTDADVHFEPSALRRAMRFAVADRLDHLVVLPRLILRGFWETVCVWFFGVIFILKFRPWRVRDPKSSVYAGVGAFNLVRAEAYRNSGGHASLPMEVGDDVKLGKRMKVGGGRADVVISDEMVRVRWVDGVGGLVRGLTKNMFAGLDYSLVMLVGATIYLLLLAVWPYAGLFVGPWPSRLLCGGTILITFISSVRGRPNRDAPPMYALGFPAAAIIVIYIFWRSAFVTLRQGGIEWRGTLYPLEDLRRGIV